VKPKHLPCIIPACAVTASRTQDGALNDDELNTFQFLCFGQPLTPDELASVRQMVAERMADGLNDAGLLFPGFMYLHTLFLTRGRLESTWTVLRLFGE
jgi:Ras family protein T1